MNSDNVVQEIRDLHGDCCLTNSYQDHGCKIDVHGLKREELTTIHGDKYQKQHGLATKLCDRLIFGHLSDSFFCSVELKGGKGAKVSEAIAQIQGGLDLAKELADSHSLGDWHPIFAYSGSINGKGKQLLRARTVSFGGKKKVVERVNCGFNLYGYLAQANS